MTLFPASELILLECNIDDMNPEFGPYVIEQLLCAGAKDAWLTPIIMKGGRAATLLSALCEQEQKEQLAEVIFAETTTLGIRVVKTERLELKRSFETAETSLGSIPVKIGKDTAGRVYNAAPEFAACRTLAMQHNKPLKEVFLEALAAWKLRR